VYKNKTFLGIIPARGGSKRLPKKNVLNLCGKPLVAWSIEAGLNSSYLDMLVVSSDDDQILDIASHSRVHTLKRPDELATDVASTFDTLKHVLDKIEKHDYVVLLQPTSPLRTENHIDDAIEFLEAREADAIVSVCEADHNPSWCGTLDDSLSMKGFLKDEFTNKRSQDLEKFYKLNGAIYICKVDKLLEEKKLILKDKVYAFIMDRKSSIDIDEQIDFKIAESIMKDT
tara:strand:- start:191 stop:877 length:687 start_codon:yes stop_codon:yes gene_type:complete